MVYYLLHMRPLAQSRFNIGEVQVEYPTGAERCRLSRTMGQT